MCNNLLLFVLCFSNIENGLSWAILGTFKDLFIVLIVVILCIFQIFLYLCDFVMPNKTEPNRAL